MPSKGDSLFRLFLPFFLIFFLAACVTAPAPEKLTDDQLASTLVLNSGLDRMITDHFNYHMQELSDEKISKLSERQKRVLEIMKVHSQIMRKYYQSTKEKMHEYVLHSFSREEKITMLSWYTSSLGVKIRRALNEAPNDSEGNKFKALIKWRDDYEKGLVLIDKPRFELCKKITQLDGYMEYNLDYRKAANEGFRDGLGTKRGVHNRRYQIVDDVEKYEREITLGLYFLTQSIDLDDLNKYVAFLEKPYVTRFNKTAWKPISNHIHDYWRTIGSIGRKDRSPANIDEEEFQ